MEQTSTEKVSVVIPCYNAQRWICDTIRSVIEQTYDSSQVEIVVVDDGSTDDTVSILKRFAGGKINLIRTGNNGVSHARNIGTSEATGTYLQYLDADDLLLPDAVSARIAALKSSGADLACGPFERVFEVGDGSFEVEGIGGLKRLEEFSFDAELATLKGFWFPPAGLMYRRALVDRIGGWNEDFKIIQDARFLQDALRLGARVAYLDIVLARYRLHEGGLSRNTHAFQADILKNIIKTNEDWLPNNMTSERKNWLVDAYSRSAEFFFWCDAEMFLKAVSALSDRTLPWSWKTLYLSLCRATADRIGPEQARRALAPTRVALRILRAVKRRVSLK